MKIFFFKPFVPCFMLGSLLLVSFSTMAQNLFAPANPSFGGDEKTLREKMKNDGVLPLLIEKFIREKRLWNIKEKNIHVSSQNKGVNPVPFAACSNMGAENGWGSWQGAVGDNSSGNPPAWNFSGTPSFPNFVITTGAGIDPCTPAINPSNSPTIPVVAPGFGNSSIQAGQPQTNGCVAEQLTYQLTVTPADTNFIFAYAIVIQDAGHSVSEQPFVELCIRDQSNNPLPCGCFRYTGGPNLPGFYQATCWWNAYYKPWTIVGVNLSAYVGQTLTVTILNVDCSLCGHFAHSYWDFTCSPLGSAAASYCIGQSTSICGPIDPQINYTYQWYQNGSPYTGPPSDTAQCITPTPQPGDTFVVQVSQASNCNFSMTFVPQTMTINPNFNYTINCGTVTFTNTTTTSDGSPIAAWNWSFPGGTPSSSTTQDPVVTFPAGTHTVTLVATAQSGCLDTIIQTVLVTGVPAVAFSSTTVCEGNITQFSDNSVPATGDPIVGWSWGFPGGSPSSSNSQNPSVLFPSGTYTASLTVTSQLGCTSTITQTVIINSKPAAALIGNNVCFNNLSTFTDLSTGNDTVTNWDWNFGDNSPNSPLQNPTHTYLLSGTYTVTLIVTNNYGCMDTNTTTVVVNPIPMASFSSATACFGDTTCFQDNSTISGGSIVGWSWNLGENGNPNNISNLQNPCIIYSSAGTYNAMLTVTSNNGCQSTIILPVTVNSLPVAAFTAPNQCLNSAVSFTDISTGNPTGWNWNFGDGSPSSAVQNPSHTYLQSGTYTVTLLVTSGANCIDTTINIVTIYPLPAPNFKADTVCAGIPTTFTDLSFISNGSITGWNWSFGDGGTSTQQNPTHTFASAGNYNVTLTVTSGNGCIGTLTISTTVHAWPLAEFCVSPLQASITNPSFTFCDLWSGDVVQWWWDFGDNSPQNNYSTDPVYSYSASVTNNDFYQYTITLYVRNQWGCWDTVQHTVEILPDVTFYIPNSFTPNGDWYNEYFFGKGRGIKDYNIWLFDRWGNLIWDCHYEGKNTDWDNSGQDGVPSACKWNGKAEQGGVDMSGGSRQLAQEDVYVWKVHLTDIFDKAHNYIGHVSVVR